MLDEDALTAAIDLARRTGAVEFEIGYLHDNVPADKAAWWAKARYRGARIDVENHRGPVEAAEALARELLTGAKCNHCGGLVALSDDGAIAYERVTMSDGTEWTVEQARAAGQCRWTRTGRTWVMGCRKPSKQSAFDRSQPRRRSRRQRRRS